MSCWNLWPIRKHRPLKDDQRANSKDGSDSPPGILASCSFCHVSQANGFNVVYEDDRYIAFRDRNPASLHHIQLIPRRHIRLFTKTATRCSSFDSSAGSVRTLNHSDVEMVKEMETLGNRILDDNQAPREARKLGFHIPPLNSVNHLHLHLMSLPHLSRVKAYKYPVSRGNTTHAKGFSWFVTPSQVVHILERDQKVGVLSV
ncbi:HIT-like protein [Cylindrobasidium torrendii FP15055 ss-10]|uniref:HIT-like protein n=1 Tax=Cylindrobasidium torrendii FP15055 ss-10 TaxID=1314674 RepID=A0A0D7BUG4_9AGAR|nr:HIT-like protein [Cylindrobasidium torrendii FP15055 ss-10]